MIKKILLYGLLLLIIGVCGFLLVYKYILPRSIRKNIPVINSIIPVHNVIGFLPYWLIPRASTDYSDYLNTLDYFSLSLDTDGSIQKYTAPNESEPGYLNLTRGKVDPFLQAAKNKGLNLSLTVFKADDNEINEILNDPKASADNLTRDVVPIMKEYGFTDLNLDIEQVADASPEARMRFNEFVKNIKGGIEASDAGTLSIDISAIAFVKNTNLADPTTLVPLVDKVILMAYDYHFAGSFVTGPVAPAMGAGIGSEFDTESAVTSALKMMPSSKLILGIPLYGYEWETIGATPRSAVIPSTGLIISNERAEDFLSTCATCSATFDTTDQESHVIYKTDTGTYQQIFYPDKAATQYKIDFARKYNLGGIALWALGYEGRTILQPLFSYHR